MADQPTPPPDDMIPERFRGKGTSRRKATPPPPVRLPDVPPEMTEGVAAAAQVDVATARQRKLFDLRSLVSERRKRQQEALKLYEPLPVQQAYHKSNVKTRVVRGSNRGGKTLPAAVEFARMVLNCDPYKKYPKYGTAYVVGYDYAHHGQTIYPKLFMSQPEAPQGPFKIIKDRVTKLMRAFRPWEVEDFERADEAVEAGPLIPDRYIEEISWEKKKENVPSLIRLKTGWTIWWFSGDGRPPRGEAIDGGWIDEEIGRPDWHSELVSRCADRDGKITWSASPQSATAQLFELHKQAKRERGEKDAQVEEFHVKLTDNKHLSAQSKYSIVAANLDDLGRITRVEGEFVQSARKMYAEYSAFTHIVNLDHVPETWTRYAVIDPGHQVCAVLFAAVPRPDDRAEWGDVVLHGELYIHKSDAKKFAAEFHGATAGHQLEDWIMDMQGGRITDIGGGLKVHEQYLEELRKLGCRNRRHGIGFTEGSNDIKARVLAVRDYLRVPANGPPRMRVAGRVSPEGIPEAGLKNWEWEIERYMHKVTMTKDGPVVEDEPETRGKVHLMQCMEYLCAHRPQYVEPKPFEGTGGGVVFKAFQKKLKEQGGRPLGLMFGNPGRTD